MDGGHEWRSASRRTSDRLLGHGLPLRTFRFFDTSDRYCWLAHTSPFCFSTDGADMSRVRNEPIIFLRIDFELSVEQTHVWGGVLRSSYLELIYVQLTTECTAQTTLFYRLLFNFNTRIILYESFKQQNKLPTWYEMIATHLCVNRLAFSQVSPAKPSKPFTSAFLVQDLGSLAKMI